jgi:putative ABC transport system permease protein
MTSMTRLVDSDRSYIGTMKAMGYTNAKIALRYLLYAISASVIGSIIGIVSGFNIFPRIIFNAYKILYTLPPIQIGSHPFYTFISMTAAVACAALPAWFACLQSLKEVPAQLMRPEAPRVGKRTVLERITPLWKRLNFTQKIGVRNLFRYKKRMFMTIIGVAGCTALMFTGFGIRDSITTIVGKQYDELRKYDLQIDYTQDPQPKDIKSLQNLLNKNTDIVSSTGLHQATVDAMSGKESVSAFLVVPNEPSSLPDYVNLRNRQTQQPLTLSDNNVVITEKMADLIGVKQGDKITIRDSDVKEVVVTVGSISENYLYHYIYMTPSLYHSVFGTEPSVNQTLCHLKNPGNDANSYLSEDLLEQSAVSAVNFTTDSISIFEKMVEALRYVILVLIGSAAALVFVVLFSLTTINLEERGRELATIKVLGFFNRELAVYIYREIAVLTVFGTAIGLLLGVVLQRYIITTVEVDAVMFSRDLLWQSFAYSAALTFLFALLVDLIMLRHIAKIDMVSSLKSIE